MESGCLSLKLLPPNHPKSDQWLIFSLLMKVVETDEILFTKCWRVLWSRTKLCSMSLIKLNVKYC